MTAAKSLAGKRVVVTRAAHQAQEFIDCLRELGAEPVLVPMLEIVPPSDPEALLRALRNLNVFDILIVTSANGADAVLAALGQDNIPLPSRGSVEVLAVGAATARPLEAAGLEVTCPAGNGNAAALFKAIVGRVQGKRILAVGAEDNDDLLTHSLTRAGAIVTEVDAYKSRIPADADENIRKLFTPECNADIITFASGRTGENFYTVLARNKLALPESVATIAIGPETAKHLGRVGFPPTLIAEQTTARSLAEACARWCWLKMP